jgi:hypothetical protein
MSGELKVYCSITGVSTSILMVGNHAPDQASVKDIVWFIGKMDRMHIVKKMTVLSVVPVLLKIVKL